MHQPRQRVRACTCSPGHLRHPANTAGGARVKPAYLKRNTKQGGVSMEPSSRILQMAQLRGKKARFTAWQALAMVYEVVSRLECVSGRTG